MRPRRRRGATVPWSIAHKATTAALRSPRPRAGTRSSTRRTSRRSSEARFLSLLMPADGPCRHCRAFQRANEHRFPIDFAIVRSTAGFASVCRESRRKASRGSIHARLANPPDQFAVPIPGQCTCGAAGRGSPGARRIFSISRARTAGSLQSGVIPGHQIARSQPDASTRNSVRSIRSGAVPR